MIISMLLLIYDFSDAQIAKVSILGTEFVAGKPWVLVATAWAIWLYFLVRYVQYYLDTQERPVTSAFFEARNDTTQNFAKSKYKSLDPKASDEPVFIPDYAQEENPNAAWRIDVHEKGEKLAKEEQTKIDSWYVSNSRSTWLTFISLLKTVFKSTVFTDRILPYALAAAAFLVSALPVVWNTLSAFWC